MRLLFRLEEADKFFTGQEARDTLRNLQTNLFFQLGLTDEKVMVKGMAMLSKQLAGMEVDMLNIVGKYTSGQLGFQGAVSDWRSMASTRYQELFKAGAMASGNSYYAELGLTRQDLAFINRVRRFEERYFKKMLLDIKDPKHLPAKQIPRDAAGKRLSGYRAQKYSYEERSALYAKSAKSVFFNGQVAGGGPNVRIFWRLGPAERHCEVCPVYATNRGGEGYTWKTLPTTPRSGGTPCGIECRCSLEIHPVEAKKAPPGTASRAALNAAGRYGNVYDKTGVKVGGAVQTEAEIIMAQMNKARQMISLTTGEQKAYWITQRRDLNKLLVDMGGTNYRMVPTMSVKDLVAAAKEAQARGGFLLDDFAKLAIGDELTLIRGDFVASGMMRMEGNQMVFTDANGIKLVLDDTKDIVFMLQKESVNFHQNVTAAEKDIIRNYTGDEYGSYKRYFNMSVSGREAFKAKSLINSKIGEEAEVLEKLFGKYKDSTVQTKSIYRGAQVSESMYERISGTYQVGDVIKVGKGVTSWSYDKEVATTFTRGVDYCVRYEIKGGRRITKELSIGQYSDWAEELEVLIADTKFRIVAIETAEVPGSFGMIDEILSVVLKELD